MCPFACDLKEVIYQLGGTDKTTIPTGVDWFEQNLILAIPFFFSRVARKVSARSPPDYLTRAGGTLTTLSMLASTTTTFNEWKWQIEKDQLTRARPGRIGVV